MKGLLDNFNKVMLVFLCFTMASCSYKDRVAPIQLPDAENSVVVGDGLKISALAFVDQKKAEHALGFNVRKAGLLPVQLTFLNDGSRAATVIPEQTFLVDQENRAWPVASLERTYQRSKGYVDVTETVAGSAKPAALLGIAGAVAGLAIGVVTGENIGEAMGKGAVLGGALGAAIGGGKEYQEVNKRIKEDLEDKTLQNEVITPGLIAYGILFFPGLPEEARGARELRLAVSIGGVKQIVIIDL